LAQVSSVLSLNVQVDWCVGLEEVCNTRQGGPCERMVQEKWVKTQLYVCTGVFHQGQVHMRLEKVHSVTFLVYINTYVRGGLRLCHHLRATKILLSV
jgi:hypothetical protein